MRRIVPLLFLISLVGCASTVPRQSAEEWFNQEADRWVEAVNSSCAATHQNYTTARSPVDCVSSPPGKLTMSFPDQTFYAQNEIGVGEYLNAWCVAVMNRHGNSPLVELRMRGDKRTFGIPCKRILQKVRTYREAHPAAQ